MSAMRRISSINAENANSSEQAHILFGKTLPRGGGNVGQQG